MEYLFYICLAIAQTGMCITCFFLGKAVAIKKFIKDLDKLVEERMIDIIGKQLEAREKEDKND